MDATRHRKRRFTNTLWYCVVVLVLGLSPFVLRGEPWHLRGRDRFGFDITGMVETKDGLLAVGGVGMMARSPDGRNWTLETGSELEWFTGILHCDGQFIRIGFRDDESLWDQGRVWISKEGRNWDLAFADTIPGGFHYLIHFKGRYFIGGTKYPWCNSRRLLVSRDLRAWEQKGWGPSQSLDSIVEFHDALYAAFGDGTLSKSEDGDSWSEIFKAQPLVFKSLQANDVALLLLEEAKSMRPNGRLFRSVDGLSFVEVPVQQEYLLDRLWKVGDVFFGVTAKGVTVWSRDGMKWNEIRSGQMSFARGGLVHGNEYLVWGEGGRLYRSVNLVDWEKVSDVDPSYSQVVGSEKGFVAVSPTEVAFSTEGVDWIHTNVSNMKWVAYGNGAYVVGGASILASTNGLDWEQVLVPPEGPVIGLAYGNEEFMAVCQSPIYQGVYVSKDGFQWTREPTPTNGSLLRELYWNGSAWLGKDEYGSIFYQPIRGRREWEPVFPDLVHWVLDVRDYGSGFTDDGLISRQLWTGQFVEPQRVLYESIWVTGAGVAGNKGWLLGMSDGRSRTLLYDKPRGSRYDGYWRAISPFMERVPKSVADNGRGSVVVVGSGMVIQRFTDELDPPTYRLIRKQSDYYLQWRIRIGHIYALETSTDLMHWRPVRDERDQSEVRVYGIFNDTGELKLPHDGPHQFYRLILLETSK